VRVSVVIPVLDDRRALAALLDRLAGLEPPPDELIVVDAGDEDACRRLAEARGALYLRCRPGRGRQLAAGAAAARGRVLWFLHADAWPERAAVAAIERAITAGAVGGWFRFRFRGDATAWKRCLAALTNWRCRLGGIPYGDQGLFMLRAAYLAAGGFPDQPLFEEVPLVRRLRRIGDFRGLPQAIGVSPRRWERDGWLRRSLHNRLLAIGYLLGLPPGTLARYYRPMHAGKQGPEC